MDKQNLGTVNQNINYFLHEPIKVKKPKLEIKFYNSFSRPCKDDMPHPAVPVFSK